MKKLFISCPMKGRTEENIMKTIDKMHNIAECIFGQKLERIESYGKFEAPEGCDRRIYCLGRSVQHMAEADFFVGVSNYSYLWNGCNIEGEIARSYGIPAYFIPIEYLGDDVLETERNYHDNLSSSPTNPAD